MGKLLHESETPWPLGPLAQLLARKGALPAREAVAFMIVLPNINEPLIDMDGSLLPFNWARLLWWLHKPKSRTLRVPLMGVAKKLQNSRMASTLAFMMIEFTRRVCVDKYDVYFGEFGWVLEDNQGMLAIADTIQSKVNREYVIYGKGLG